MTLKMSPIESPKQCFHNVANECLYDGEFDYFGEYCKRDGKFPKWCPLEDVE